MRYGFWLLAAALQAASLGAACDAQAQLLINEILAAPARDWNGDAVVSSRDDEWVELYNPTGNPIILDGYRIADADTTWRMGLTGTLGPHAFRLVFGSESLEWEKATHHTPCVAICASEADRNPTALSAKGLPHRQHPDIRRADPQESDGSWSRSG